MTDTFDLQRYRAIKARINGLKDPDTISKDEFYSVLDDVFAPHWTNLQQDLLCNMLARRLHSHEVLYGLLLSHQHRDRAAHQTTGLRPDAARAWWAQADESNWLEITDRDDIGTDIEGYVYDAARHRTQAWTLVTRAMYPGDTVFHFDLQADAITSQATVAGPCEVYDNFESWSVLLTAHTALKPVSFADLARHSDAIRKLFDNLISLSKPPYYLPLVFAPNLELRRTYFAKLSRKLVKMFPALARS